MPRDSSGSYVLPLAPVVAGTPIEASWANTSLDDVAVALTDSLSRSGLGSMTASLRLVDGTKGAPANSFTNETNSGVYRAAQFDIRHSLAGEDLLRLYQDGTGDRFFQIWNGTDFVDVSSLDADAVIDNAPSTSFTGRGIATVTRPSTGVIRVVFDNAATSNFAQNVTASQYSPNGGDFYEAKVEIIDTTTVDIHCFFINLVSGAWIKQNNNGRVTVRRTLTA